MKPPLLAGLELVNVIVSNDPEIVSDFWQNPISYEFEVTGPQAPVSDAWLPLGASRPSSMTMTARHVLSEIACCCPILNGLRARECRHHRHEQQRCQASELKHFGGFGREV